MLVRIRFMGESYWVEEQLAETQPWLLAGVFRSQSDAISYVESRIQPSPREDRWDGVYYLVDKIRNPG